MQHRKTKTVSLFFLIICFLISFYAHGQTQTKQLLIKVIPQLEETYAVRFSYVPKDLLGVKVHLPEKIKDFQKVLHLLNQQTALQFTLFKNRYVTVVSFPKNQYCGTLIAWDTGQPLSGATILVSEASASTVSNASGAFFIDSKISPESTVRISYVGYFPVSLSLEEFRSDCYTIALVPVSTALDEVIISTYLVEGISKQADGSIRLNTANFGLVPGQVENDVLQIIQVLPGVESVNETISNINIRGGANFETLLLWDDIKIYQNGHFFGLISAFNPNLTKSIDLYKNGTPPRYGENISGVIAMQSHNKVVKDFSGGVAANLINASAFVSIPVSKNISLQVSGRHSLSFLKTPVYTSYSQRMFQNTKITTIKNPDNQTDISSDVDFSFYDLSTKLLWDLSEKDQIRGNFMTINNTLDFTERVENNGSKTSELQQQSVVGGISWQRNWNATIQTTALAYGSYYLLNAVNKNLFTTQEQIQENEVLETGLKLDAQFVLSDKTKLQTGYQFVETGVANTQDINLPRFRDFKKEVLRTHSLFSNLVWTPNLQKTTLEIGIRASLFNKFDRPSIEPRLSFYQKLGHGFSMEVLGEMMSQSTTQRIDYESDFLGIKKKRWTLANNKSVPLLKSRQISLGFGYNRRGWLIEAEGFYKHVKGITSASQAFQNQFQFVTATGSYSANGLEFIINKRTQNFSVWLSYLYMQNTYTFAKLVPSEFPNNIDVRHTATLAGTYSLSNFKFSVGLNWHSGKPYTIPVPGAEITTVNGQEVIHFAAPNQERLHDYFRADLSAEYLWEISPKLTAKINVAALNFFDTENTLNIHYTMNTDKNGNNRVNRVEEISLGFTPNVSVQILF